MTPHNTCALRRESTEVVRAKGKLVTVDSAAVESLVDEAARNSRRRIRLCAHPGTDDPVHEMFIVHARDCYVRPHKHLAKSESFHIVEGTVDVVVFDDEGEVTNVVEMSTYSTGLPFFYRIAAPLFHTLLIRSEVLVFHETTKGPFLQTQTIFAPWAPDGSDPDMVATYIAGLQGAVAQKLPGRRNR